jgi:putative membrane protein (TIGR04086 family)
LHIIKNKLTVEKNNYNSSKLKIIFSSVLAALSISTTVFIFYAILITYTNITEKNMSLVATTTIVIVMAIAGFETARSCEKKGWMWGIVAGLSYAILLILISFVILDSLILNFQIFMILILAIASGGVGGILGINFKKK